MAWAAPRFGAPRALRVVDSGNRPLDGELLDPAWGPGGNLLYFTRQWGGTRNIWRAVPQEGSKNRFAAWQAAPVTRFEPPFQAHSPQPTQDGRALVCVTNSVNAAGFPQVDQVAVLDLRSGALRALTSGPYRCQDPAISNDGTVVAFTSNRSGFDSIYLLPVSTRDGALETPRRAVLRARYAAWGADNTLLFDSLKPLNPGIHRLARPGDPASQPVLLAPLSGRTSTTATGAQIVVAAADAKGGTQLYSMGSDGSGLKALGATAGAELPAYSPDGNAVAYQARLAQLAGAPRGLWLLSVLRDPPVARLAEVRPGTEGALAIIGTIAGEEATARLEVGQGESPRRFESLPVAPPPVYDAPIALWKAPADARGSWVIRLTVTGVEGGSAQASMLVTLPLKTEAADPPGSTLVPPQIPVPVVPLPGVPGRALAPADTQTKPLQRPEQPGYDNPLPVNPPPNSFGNRGNRQPAPQAIPAVPPRAIPASTSAPTSAPVAPPTVPTPLPPPAGGLSPADPARFPLMPPMASTPAPATVPGPPASRPLPPMLPVPAANAGAVAVRPALPTVRSGRTAPGGTSGSKVPNVPSRPSVAPSPRRVVQPPVPVTRPPAAPSPSRPKPARVADQGTLNVSGTLASLQPGQKISVTAWVKNGGSSVWPVRSASGDAVRVVARWLDLETGRRRKWEFNWLPEDVNPGGSARWQMDISAPTRPGRYKLIYGLLRVPESGYGIPDSATPQEKWPGEFSAIAFAVTVR